MSKKKDERQAILGMAAETIGKDILGALAQEIKMLPDVWQKTSESKQNDVIDRLRKRVENNVKMAVHLIASNGRSVVTGDLEQVTIKDGVKATIKFSSSAASIASLYESTGKAVLVVVGGSEEFMGGMDAVKGESDQRAMDLGKEYDPNGDGKGMDNDDHVIDAEVRELPAPEQPEFTEEELQEMYQAGRQAAEEGKSDRECPRVASELVKYWMRGYRQWHEEQEENTEEETEGQSK